MGFSYRLYPSYNGFIGVGGKGIAKMIDQLIRKSDAIPGLSTKPNRSAPRSIQSKCADCADEGEKPQRIPVTIAPLPSRISALNGPLAERFQVLIQS
jgi:hypothetical protein